MPELFSLYCFKPRIEFFHTFLHGEQSSSFNEINLQKLSLRITINVHCSFWSLPSMSLENSLNSCKFHTFSKFAFACTPVCYLVHKPLHKTTLASYMISGYMLFSNGHVQKPSTVLPPYSKYCFISGYFYRKFDTANWLSQWKRP